MTNRFTSIYDELLQFIDFVVHRTSDSLAGILIKALPLLAPVPNAISIWRIVQEAPLNYDRVQAGALAAAVEGMFFALTEVVLNMFDGWLDDAQRYLVPLWISIGAFVGYFILIMWVVAQIETSIVARAFPVVSLIAAIVLGCARWHKRNSATSVVRKAKPAQSKPDIVQAEVTGNLQESHSKLTAIVQPDTDAIDKRQRAHQLHSEGLSNTEIGKELDAHRNTVRAWLKGTNGYHKEAA